MRKLCCAVVLCLALVLSACGVGTSKRFLTRPDSYAKMMGFPATGKPLDLEALKADFGELAGDVDGKPRIVTAPQYIEEYAAMLLERKARGDDSALIPYRIPAGLQILIEVIGENISRQYTVGPHGYIDVPMIGEVSILGKTLRQAKDEIAERFKKYIKNPEVLVNVLSSPNYIASAGGSITGGQTIYGGDIIVLGATQARTFQNINYTGKESLITVLGSTGLPEDAEWRQIRVIRRSETDPLRNSRIIVCDLWSYFAIGDVRQDIPLMPGDVVFVPIKWSSGDQFHKDWKLLLEYITGSFTLDDLREGVRRPSGRFVD